MFPIADRAQSREAEVRAPRTADIFDASMRPVHPLHWLGFLLGCWLHTSRFLWPHSAPQFVNTWLVSVFYTSLVLAAIGFPLMRRAEQVLAAWLFVSAWLLPRASEATLWNNLLVALVMAAVTARVDAYSAS